MDLVALILLLAAATCFLLDYTRQRVPLTPLGLACVAVGLIFQFTAAGPHT